MLELLYPAVLGTVIYSIIERAILPTIEKLLGYQSNPAGPNTILQLILLLITAFFYCIDYLYVMFTRDYDRFFFACDLLFLLTLSLTVGAIGLSGAGQHPPALKLILVCYCIFLAVYFVWDRRAKRGCDNEDERNWYNKILAWEIVSFLVLVVLFFIVWGMQDHKCAGYVVAVVIGLITAVFAPITWQKKRFYKEATE